MPTAAISTVPSLGKAKLRLIQATLDSLMEEGMEGCSVRKISERAGVSTGLIHYHFSSIDKLIAASYRHLAFEYLQSAIQACSVYSGQPREQISAFLHDVFSSKVMQRKVLRAWVVFWGLLDSSDAIKRAQEESNNAFAAFLERLFIELHEQIRLKSSPRMAAIGLSALIDGLWLEWCLQPDQFSRKECLQLCEQWTDGLIYDVNQS